MTLSAEEQRAIDGARGREPGWKIGYEATLLAIIDRQQAELDQAWAAEKKAYLDAWFKTVTDALATWIKEKLIAEARERAAAALPLTDAERSAVACAKVGSSHETDALVEIIERLAGVVIPAADESAEP